MVAIGQKLLKTLSRHRDGVWRGDGDGVETFLTSLGEEIGLQGGRVGV